MSSAGDLPVDEYPLHRAVFENNLIEAARVLTTENINSKDKYGECGCPSGVPGFRRFPHRHGRV